MNQSNRFLNADPDFTPEIVSRIEKVLDSHEKGRKSLIPVLAECQEILGYLPVALQEYIAIHLNIPGSDVYGVVTFYSYFTMVPRGRHTIKVCMGTACYVRGIQEILNRIQQEFNLKVGDTTNDRRFSLEAVRCLGACGLAPVMVVDDNTHGRVSPNAVLDILSKYE